MPYREIIIMTIKKKLFICIPLICIFVLIAVAMVTRVKNYNGVYHDGEADNEYLDVYDLRLLEIIQDEDQKEYLESITVDMIKEAFSTNGESSKYSDVISKKYMKSLDPKPSYPDYEYELGTVDVYCLVNNDKAIVFMTSDNEVSGNKLTCNKVYQKKEIYDRVYFAKENNTWVVKSVCIPA